MSANPAVDIQIVSYGFSRVKPGFMAAAPVPAAEMALANAGLKITDMKAIKSHNPFATNDINFAKKLGIDVMKMNNFGCSLIYGHPQAPTAGQDYRGDVGGDGGFGWRVLSLGRLRRRRYRSSHDL